MRFSVGDKVVYPHRGPGRVVDIERREFLEGPKRYYVIEIPTQAMTVHVPVRKVDQVGLRPAMSRAKVARVLDILCSKPQRLPKDFKVRQEMVWEKLKTGRPAATAETVRDLSWRKESAHLTKKDSELLLRGQEFLAAELALVLSTDIPEAEEWISSALATAITAGKEREQSAQLA